MKATLLYSIYFHNHQKLCNAWCQLAQVYPSITILLRLHPARFHLNSKLYSQVISSNHRRQHQCMNQVTKLNSSLHTLLGLMHDYIQITWYNSEVQKLSTYNTRYIDSINNIEFADHGSWVSTFLTRQRNTTMQYMMCPSLCPQQ